MSAKKQPIDPICAICRLAMLNFKDVHTKIGVSEHAINIQEPGGTQKFMRFYYGDNREDVFELFYLITHMIAWFLVPEYNKSKIEFTHNHDAVNLPPNSMSSSEFVVNSKQIQKNGVDERFTGELRKIVMYMCQGLGRLQDTYKGGNVVLALQYYINLLTDGLNNNFSLGRIPDCLTEDLDLETALKSKIVSMWNYDRLHVVCDLYDNCLRELKKNNNKKSKIIDGYLLSIDKILVVYEDEFKQQLKQWG